MKRIGEKITLLVILAEIVAMVIMFMFLNIWLSNILEERVISDMGIIAHHRADLAENYIEGRCDFLNGYARSPEAINALMHPDDPECIKAARDYTLRYAEGYDTIEGLYIADWDTYVLAHINPDSMDKTFREGDAAKELEEQVRAHRDSFCTGIVLAPVTQKMVMPVYAPVINDEGEMVGFAGAAFYPEAIGIQLDVDEETKYGYAIINCANQMYIYDALRPELVGTECTDADLWNEVARIKADPKEQHGAHTQDGQVMSIYYMPDYDWIFIVSEPESEVYKLVERVRNMVMLIFVLVTILLIFILRYVITGMMAPIEKINNQIVRLEIADYSRGHGIEKFTKRNDEFGTISRAVMKLHNTLENQDEIFKEMLDAQTAGMVVSRNVNSELLLINQKAKALYGIPEDQTEGITIESIRKLFTKEELEHIDEQLSKVSPDSDEVEFESCIIHDNGEKHYLLTRIKSVTLSNGDYVSIYSLMDITEQKKLEENLKIQSETDFLTGICNRRSGEFRVEKLIAEGKTGMFCLLDANKFKIINDTYGHDAGDEVLVGISNAMKDTFRSSDVLIRLGGDEFVIFAPGMPDETVGANVINRFIKNVESISPKSIKGHTVTISLGAVMVNDKLKFSEMYACADAVMYECKEKGGSAFAFYHMPEA